MISAPAFPIAGRSTRPVSFTRPDSQKTSELTEAGPEIRFKPKP